jgi:hypothetical protein
VVPASEGPSVEVCPNVETLIEQVVPWHAEPERVMEGSRPRTTPLAVVSAALQVCRRQFGTLALIGIIVFAPLAALEAFAVGFIGDRESGALGHRTVALTAYLGISLLMLGSALCAGLLDTVVGHEFGEENVGWQRAVRTLPYGRLVGVDLSQALIIGTLSVLGFVPGLIAFTLTCLAGSLVMIEHRGVRSALVRSVALTRGRFGLTLVVVTLPVAVEHQVVHALTASMSMPFAAAWLVHAVAAVVFLVPVVVVEITLAHQLRHDERAALLDAPAGSSRP